MAANERQGVQPTHAQRPDLIFCGLPLANGSGADCFRPWRNFLARPLFPEFFNPAEDRITWRRAMERGGNGQLEYPGEEASLIAIINSRLIRLQGLR